MVDLCALGAFVFVSMVCWSQGVVVLVHISLNTVKVEIYTVNDWTFLSAEMHVAAVVEERFNLTMLVS